MLWQCAACPCLRPHDVAHGEYAQQDTGLSVRNYCELARFLLIHQQGSIEEPLLGQDGRGAINDVAHLSRACPFGEQALQPRLAHQTDEAPVRRHDGK